MYLHVRLAKETSIKLYPWLDYFNPFLFQLKYGLIFPWISLKGFPRLTGRMSFWWWLIGGLSMLISLHLVIYSSFYSQGACWTFCQRHCKTTWFSLLYYFRSWEKISQAFLVWIIQSCWHKTQVQFSLPPLNWCLTDTQPKQWPKWLSWAEFWFNSNYNNFLKLTPFKALYGRDPPHLLNAATVPSVVQDVNVLTQDRDQMSRDLKENLAKAQNLMKRYLTSFDVLSN